LASQFQDHVLLGHTASFSRASICRTTDATVVTGSFNYTWSAEHRNGENLLVIHDPALAAGYTVDWV